MPDINAEELLRKAWEEFCGDYDKKVREYSKSEFVRSRKQAEKEHWVCWNEADLMVQLGRFFYKQLHENSHPNIEVHFDKFVSHSSFEEYTFEKEGLKLKKLKDRLGRVPKSDLIIVQENSLGRFLLCAEAKCFHYAVGRYYRNPQEVIEKDIDTLVAIRDLGIAERVVFILFDDYYWIRNEDIESVVVNACKEHNITLLKHNSKAKLERWK